MADEENEVVTTEETPVNPIDPNSLVQGCLTGCRLKPLRGKK